MLNFNPEHARFVDYPGIVKDRYVITDQGVVFDTKRNTIVRYFNDRDGYFRVSVKAEGKGYVNVFVHRLVAHAFIENPNPEINTVVNHLDGCKKFNFDSNLEWCTVKRNTNHAEEIGTRIVRGDGNGNSRYSEAFIHSICRRYAEGASVMDVFEELFHPAPLVTQRDFDDYNLCRNIKRKTAWPSVTSQYEYSTNVREDGQPVRKAYIPKAGKNPLTEQNVHWICQQTQDGMTPVEIVERMLHGEAPDPLPSYIRRERLHDMVGSITRGKTWARLPTQYDFSKRNNGRMPPHI